MGRPAAADLPSTQGFSARLRAVIAEKGWTAAELVRRTKISTQAMSGYTTGQREPSGLLLLQLARELGVRPEWLLIGDGPKREAAATNKAGQADRVLADLHERLSVVERVTRSLVLASAMPDGRHAASKGFLDLAAAKARHAEDSSVVGGEPQDLAELVDQILKSNRRTRQSIAERGISLVRRIDERLRTHATRNRVGGDNG